MDLKVPMPKNWDGLKRSDCCVFCGKIASLEYDKACKCADRWVMHEIGKKIDPRHIAIKLGGDAIKDSFWIINACLRIPSGNALSRESRCMFIDRHEYLICQNRSKPDIAMPYGLQWHYISGNRWKCWRSGNHIGLVLPDFGFTAKTSNDEQSIRRVTHFEGNWNYT